MPIFFCKITSITADRISKLDYETPSVCGGGWGCAWGLIQLYMCSLLFHARTFAEIYTLLRARYIYCIKLRSTLTGAHNIHGGRAHVKK